MRVLVLATACLTVVCADVSHLTSGYNYNAPTSYNVPLNPFGSAGNIQLPVHEQTTFTSNLFNPSSTAATFNTAGGSFGGNAGFSGFGGNSFQQTGFSGGSNDLAGFGGPVVGVLGGNQGVKYQTTSFENHQHSTGFGNQDATGNAGAVAHLGGQTENSGFSSHHQSGSSSNVEVSKHLYFYTAPEEPSQARGHVEIPAGPVKKNVKILFIKAPTYDSAKSYHIAAQPQNEEKTLVYVLVKKPDDQASISVGGQVSAPPSKPEVFFVKYKTQEDAQRAIAQIQNGLGADGASISANAVNGDQAFLSALNAGTHGGASSGEVNYSGFQSSGNTGSVSHTETVGPTNGGQSHYTQVTSTVSNGPSVGHYDHSGVSEGTYVSGPQSGVSTGSSGVDSQSSVGGSTGFISGTVGSETVDTGSSHSDLSGTVGGSSHSSGSDFSFLSQNYNGGSSTDNQSSGGTHGIHSTYGVPK